MLDPSALLSHSGHLGNRPCLHFGHTLASVCLSGIHPWTRCIHINSLLSHQIKLRLICCRRRRDHPSHEYHNRPKPSASGVDRSDPFSSSPLIGQEHMHVVQCTSSIHLPELKGARELDLHKLKIPPLCTWRAPARSWWVLLCKTSLWYTI